jgi:hypothetical protein
MEKKLTAARAGKLKADLLAQMRARHRKELEARPAGAPGLQPPHPTSKQKRQAKTLAGLRVQAERRLGSSPIRQLQWLLRLSQLSEKDLVRELSDSKSSLPLELALFTVHDPALFAHRGDRDAARAGLLKALAKIKHGLDSLADASGWILSYPSGITSELGKTDQQRMIGTFGRPLDETYRSKDGPTAFLLRAKDLVKLEGSRLARCDAKECRRLFVRRKRGLFCGKKCGLRERVRAYRERHAQNRPI